MKNKQSSMTLAVLTNGAALVAAIFQKLAPDAVTKEVAGSEVTVATACNMAQTIFEQELGTKINTPQAFKG